MSDNITVYLNVYKHNDDKSNQPDYRGKMDIDDQVYNGSIKTSTVSRLTSAGKSLNKENNYD